jgi:hypothetical protein
MAPKVLGRYTAILLVLLVLAGCASPASQLPTQAFLTATPGATQPPIQPPAATASPSPTSAPTPPPPKRTQYDLSAVLDYWGHTLTVGEQIDYTNNTPDALSELQLVVEPLLYSGTFTLESMNWSSGEAIQPTYEGEILRLPLAQPLAPGESIGISLSYTLNLPSPVPDPSIRPIPFGHTARQTNLVDWYPFIPPYIPGQGWLINPPSYYGEHLAYEIADFTVRIQSQDAGTPLTIAASAPAAQEGEWQVYRHEAARNFAWSASHEYATLTAQAGPVTVTSYYFPIHANAGQATLQTTVEAVELYTRLYGEYPRSTLSVVEADFLDGMEYDGLYFLSNGFYNLYTGTPGEYLVAIAAHETAHQWFYARIGNDQANEPWLDEALCTYSERLYYENLHPEALDWWWNYRINYYNPHGWVDTTVYNPQGSAQPYSDYRAAVYFNGAVFLEELRGFLGETAFFDFLETYAVENALKIATGKDFFNLLERFTSEDLRPVLEKYFSTSYLLY